MKRQPLRWHTIVVKIAFLLLLFSEEMCCVFYLPLLLKIIFQYYSYRFLCSWYSHILVFSYLQALRCHTIAIGKKARNCCSFLGLFEIALCFSSLLLLKMMFFNVCSTFVWVFTVIVFYNACIVFLHCFEAA